MNGDGTMTAYDPSINQTHPRPGAAYAPAHGQRLSGSGAPAANLGNVGDVYTNTANDVRYTKTSEGWKVTG